MNTPSRDRFIHEVDIYLSDTEETDSTASLVFNVGQVIESAVACLVMDKGGRRQFAYGREIERKKIRVLFPDYIALREGHVLKYTTPAGIVRWFLVDSFRDDQDMGRLWVAECDEVPNPTDGTS